MSFDVDDFSGYWEAFSRNLDGPQPSLIGTADRILCKCFRDLNPKGRVNEVKMFSASFAGIRAATMLTLGGATMHVPTVLRLALESVAYGALFGSKPEWYAVWENRHESDSDKQKFRNSGLKEAKLALKTLGQGFDSDFTSLYQMLIDIGAHPNVLGIDASVEAEKIDSKTDFFTFQHLSTNFERLLAFYAIGQTSVFLVNIIANSWQNELKNQDLARDVYQLLEQLEALDKELEREQQDASQQA